MNPIAQLLLRRSLHGAVRHALESGVGLYLHTWRTRGKSADELAAELLGWCRSTLGLMRRPYGVDSVSLAVALRHDGERSEAGTSFPVVSPAAFYGGPVEHGARTALSSWERAGLLRSGRARLSAALFSWGDLTQELVLAGEPPASSAAGGR